MARKIQPRSKTPKPTPGQSSEDYWRERETRQRAANIHDEARYAARINDIFQSTQDSIQQEIESFYQRYAKKEEIDIAEARRRVSKIDMEKYERLAAQYVKAAHEGGREAAFSDIANEQMRLYNATMRINRLEMLKARCGIRAMEGYRLADQLINEALEERTYSEYYRLAGILGNTVQFNENMVRSIVNASYQNATWSQRLWNNQALLSERIGAQIAQGILTGKGSDVLARNIQKLTGQSTYVCQRLMRTELRRVQTAAAEQSMLDNGVTAYKFLVANGVNPCDECLSMDGQVFKLPDMNVGKNAPPLHPSCHCCTAPALDEEKWQRWLDGPAQAGVPWAQFEHEEDGVSKIYSDSRSMMNKILEEVDKKLDHEPITISQLDSSFSDDIFAIIRKSPDFIRKVINANLNRIGIVNENCVGQPCNTSKGIRLNIWKDKNNELGSWNTLFHEVGHRIDFLYGTISDTNSFRKALNDDFENTVRSVMLEFKMSRNEAYHLISDSLGDNPLLASVSDIYGALTDNKCVGSYGHFDDGYWDDRQNLMKEAFANFFSTYTRGNKDELFLLEEAFPTSTTIFKNMMRRVTK